MIDYPEKKLKYGKYIYKMEIPVIVHYHRRDDGSVSIDSVCVPDEEELYGMTDARANKIRAGAELRMGYHVDKNEKRYNVDPY